MKCSYCGDPVLKFQSTCHDGCAKLAGIREVVDFIEKTKYWMSPHDRIAWSTKLKEWGIED